MKKDNVIIVGGGLSGLTAASYLADTGVEVTVLEQGKRYMDRNVQNGEEVLSGLGGAGTLAGGKLCFPPASGGIWKRTGRSMRAFQPFCQEMLSDLHTLLPLPQSGGWLSGKMNRKIYRSELVLGNEMRAFVNTLIGNVIHRGADIRCGCQVTGLGDTERGKRVFFLNEGGERERLDGGYVVFATGRTSVPLLRTLFRPGPGHQPDLGIRLTADRNQPVFSAAGEDVKLKLNIGPYLVRTFCVCCGGASIKTSTGGLIHYDGHFETQLTDHTNFGVLARSPVYSGPDAVRSYLEAMQRYADIQVSLKDFLLYRNLLARGTIYAPLFEALAGFISELYRGGMLVQNPDEVPVFLPAADQINPLIPTDSGFESTLPNVYVTGDALGISRGFIQAMWAGRCAAEQILDQMARERSSWGIAL